MSRPHAPPEPVATGAGTGTAPCVARRTSAHDVTDGRVALTGTVEHKSVIPVAMRLCRGVNGVVDATEVAADVIDSLVAVPDAGASLMSRLMPRAPKRERYGM